MWKVNKEELFSRAVFLTEKYEGDYKDLAGELYNALWDSCVGREEEFEKADIPNGGDCPRAFWDWWNKFQS